MAQYARPSSDDSVGLWYESTGDTQTNIYVDISEETRDDNDYIYSQSNQATACQIQCSSVTDPAVHTGHVVRYTYMRTNSGKNLTLVVTLYSGATQIAQWSHVNPTTSFSLAQQTLSEAQAGNITNYADLSLHFNVTVNAGGGNQALVSWAEIEVPGGSTTEYADLTIARYGAVAGVGGASGYGSSSFNRVPAISKSGFAQAGAVASADRILELASSKRQIVRVNASFGRGALFSDGGYGQATSNMLFGRILDMSSYALGSAIASLVEDRVAQMALSGRSSAVGSVTESKSLEVDTDGNVVFLASVAFARALLVANGSSALAKAGLPIARSTAVSESAEAIARAAVLYSILRELSAEGDIGIDVSVTFGASKGASFGGVAAALSALGLTRGLAVSQEAGALVYGILSYALARGVSTSSRFTVSGSLQLALDRALTPSADAAAFADWYSNYLQGIDSSGAAVSSSNVNVALALALAVASGGSVTVTLSVGRSSAASVSATGAASVTVTLPIMLDSAIARSLTMAGSVDISARRIVGLVSSAVSSAGLSLAVLRAMEASGSETQLWVASLLRTYVVPPESRVFVVEPENRTYSVRPETRVHQVEV